MTTDPAWIQIFLDTPAEIFEDAVEFWSAVTGWRPSDRRGQDGQFLTLLPSAGPAYVRMQAVEQPAGLHLDLDSADRPAAIEHARSLGATTAWCYHDVEVMRSPGGFVFCQTLLHDSPGLDLVRDGSTILDQACLDIPPDAWEAEVAFWRDITGRELQTGSLPGFVRLVEDGRPRILLQRLDSGTGPVRAHPDLATATRTDDVRRHLELGASLQAEHDFWSVMRAPGGQVYCLTDRDPATGRVQ